MQIAVKDKHFSLSETALASSTPVRRIMRPPGLSGLGAGGPVPTSPGETFWFASSDIVVKVVYAGKLIEDLDVDSTAGGSTNDAGVAGAWEFLGDVFLRGKRVSPLTGDGHTLFVEPTVPYVEAIARAAKIAVQIAVKLKRVPLADTALASSTPVRRIMRPPGLSGLGRLGCLDETYARLLR